MFDVAGLEEFVACSDGADTSKAYQLEEVEKSPVRMSAQYMHGCECSENEKRKRIKKNGDVFGNGRRKSGIHHRKQYMVEKWFSAAESVRLGEVWLEDVNGVGR